MKLFLYPLNGQRLSPTIVLRLMNLLNRHHSALGDIYTSSRLITSPQSAGRPAACGLWRLNGAARCLRSPPPRCHNTAYFMCWTLWAVDLWSNATLCISVWSTSHAETTFIGLILDLVHYFTNHILLFFCLTNSPIIPFPVIFNETDNKPFHLTINDPNCWDTN